ncbi:hypothetical protein J2S59_000580 [Nocardioides massiliensis]|uniref:Uncharacterized protein n=1 Tax=Nocardioides massiliensis TaxID=1325935 RepID=A0ABT9NK92_9ACTN|nr:hypothetical protein [Nocardioides massiliensis]
MSAHLSLPLTPQLAERGATTWIRSACRLGLRDGRFLSEDDVLAAKIDGLGVLHDVATADGRLG